MIFRRRRKRLLWENPFALAKPARMIEMEGWPPSMPPGELVHGLPGFPPRPGLRPGRGAGGQGPPDPLHRGSCAPRTPCSGGLRPPEPPARGSCAPRTPCPGGLRPPDPPDAGGKAPRTPLQAAGAAETLGERPLQRCRASVGGGSKGGTPPLARGPGGEEPPGGGSRGAEPPGEGSRGRGAPWRGVRGRGAPGGGPGGGAPRRPGMEGGGQAYGKNGQEGRRTALNENKLALVVGMARSGVAAALLLAEKGYALRLADQKGKEQLAQALEPLKGVKGVEYRLGEPAQDLLEGVELVVISPGVPITHPVVKAPRRRAFPALGSWSWPPGGPRGGWWPLRAPTARPPPAP